LGRFHAIRYSVLAAFTLALATLHAQPVRAGVPVQQTLVAPADISSILDSITKDHPVPALAAVVIEGDRIVMEGVTGVRAKGSPEKATLDDQWLGSYTGHDRHPRRDACQNSHLERHTRHALP
jgi:hypothetical protein